MIVKLIVLICSMFSFSLVGGPIYTILIGMFGVSLYYVRFLSNRDIALFLVSVTILIINFFYYEYIVYNPNTYIVVNTNQILNNLAGKVIIVFSIIVLYKFIRLESEILKKTLKFVLYTHLFFFYSQVVLFLLTNKYIDYSGIFLLESARFDTGVSGANFWSLPRFTGFFIEPSHYGILICFLFMSLHFLGGDVNKYVKLMLFISALLTMSSATIFIASVCIIYLAYERYGLFFTIIWFFVICILIGVVFFEKINEIYQYQLYRLSFSSGIRGNLFDLIMEREGSDFIFGSSLYSIESKIYFDSIFTESRSFASEKDAGTFVYMLIRFGVFGLIVYLLSLVYFLRKRIIVLIVFIFLSLSKVSIDEPIYWVLVFSTIYFSNKETST